MGDTRIVYGLAFGKQGNWYTTWQTKTHGILAQASTSPDVTAGVLFYTANSAATTITDFKVNSPGNPGGNQAPLFEGKVIKVFFTDGNTTVSNNSRIYLSGSSNTTFMANSWLGLIYHNSAWYETERSINPVPTSAITYTMDGTNNAITVTNQTRIAILTGTGAAVTVSGISGGYVGQSVTLIAGSGGGTIYLPNTQGNIIYQGTANFALEGINSASGLIGINVVKVTDSYWTIPGFKI